MASIAKSLFISHGGGPLPLLDDPNHNEMVSCLKEIAVSIPKPEAIIVISAHWEENVPTITANTNPELIYDYYNFPPESYEIQYACKGKPTLANDIYKALESSGITAQLDDERGFDHGLFIPLKIMYPEADIPCVQLSLVKSLDPALHISIGKALQKLQHQNVLIIGSGFSFHNMQAFFAEDSIESSKLNTDFETWLKDTCSSSISEKLRSESLIHWVEAPGARYCHPREEHLLPLHVCYGFAESACSKSYELQILNKKSSMYLWENES